jgi:glucose-6-phosphate isomerase
MFRGEKINVTENRAVLHVALRAPKGASVILDGQNVVPQVHARSRGS